MRVRQLDPTCPKDVRQFIALPFHLYRDNALWVPPLLPEMHRVLDPRKHPFYEHSDAAFFVVESAHDMLGRIAVLHHRRFNAFRQQRAAFFYYPEMVDDAQVSQELFAAAFDWTRQQQLDTMIGPKGFLQADAHGILVEGFEHRPALGVPYNFPYYDRALGAVGFTKETDYLSGQLRRGHQLSPRIYEVAEKVKRQRGFTVTAFASRKDLRAAIPRIGRIYNEAFAEHWEFCPVTAPELQVIADRLVSVADPRLIKLVLKSDEIVGFVFAFHDISEGIQRARGRLWPFGWMHLMRAFRRTRWVNFNGIGLLPKHQGLGATAVLYTELANCLSEYSFEAADVVQVDERNIKSFADMTAIGVHWYKRHRMYRRSL